LCGARRPAFSVPHRRALAPLAATFHAHTVRERVSVWLALGGIVKTGMRTLGVECRPDSSKRKNEPESLGEGHPLFLTRHVSLRPAFLSTLYLHSNHARRTRERTRAHTLSPHLCQPPARHTPHHARLAGPCPQPHPVGQLPSIRPVPGVQADAAAVDGDGRGVPHAQGRVRHKVDGRGDEARGGGGGRRWRRRRRWLPPRPGEPSPLAGLVAPVVALHASTRVRLPGRVKGLEQGVAVRAPGGAEEDKDLC
jgi:hypothetical protein